MEYLIVLLLILILIALVSGNPKAAGALRKLGLYVCVVAIALIGWLLWIVGLIALEERAQNFREHQEWYQMLGVAIVGCFPIFYLWGHRQSLKASLDAGYQRAIFWMVRCMVVPLLWLPGAWLGLEVYLSGYDLQIWGAILLGSGMVLAVCSGAKKSVTHEVWFGALPKWELLYAIDREYDQIQGEFIDANGQVTGVDWAPLWSAAQTAKALVETRKDSSPLVCIPARSLFWASGAMSYMSLCMALWEDGKRVLLGFKVFAQHDWMGSTTLSLVFIVIFVLVLGARQAIEERSSESGVQELIRGFNLRKITVVSPEPIVNPLST